MSKSHKTEAIVLRSMRYGEADCILHLYTALHGRINAIVKGVRRSRSRFGGRLEPFFRVELVLHEGRGELETVTAASTVDGYMRLRSRRDSIAAAQSACEAVLRLLDDRERNSAAYNLLCNHLALLDADSSAARRAASLAFRAKLLVASGFAPELGVCASCGGDPLVGFSPAAGGVVCADCAEGSFRFDPEAHTFLCEALAKPLAEAPDAAPVHLRQAERALGETLEHHAHVRLRAVS